MKRRAQTSRCELGPIRPPSEASSLLVRVTRNCPWNGCLFCPVYKGRPFEKRDEEEVMAEIDRLADAAARVRERLGLDGSRTSILGDECLDVVHDTSASYEERRIALWLHRGEGHVFLQDADSLILPYQRVVRTIERLKQRFPEIRRITTYARSRTLFAKKREHLVALREAGLTRVHVGVESGSDEVLAFVGKGCRAEHHITGISRAKEAGLEVSCYVMPGLGGRALSDAHAKETAAVLKAIDPTHVRLRTMFIVKGFPLYEKVGSGEMELLEEDETVAEIRVLLGGLRGVDGFVVSDHDHNLLMDVAGHLTRDADTLDSKLARFLDLPRETRESFIAARRSGQLRSLDHFLANPELSARFMPLARELKHLGQGSLVAGMLERFEPRLF